MGIQMNQKELSETFMLISNWIKPSGLHGLYTKYSALWGLRATFAQLMQVVVD